MEFRILGPLEVCNESETVVLGGVKPRAVMAVLLLHANESVHSDRLALALWGEDAPATAVKTVQVYVSRLRRALGDPDILVTTPAGYRLRVRAGELDAERFESLVEDGRQALAAGQVEAAGRVLREALGLWRGSALEDLAYEPFAQVEIARLEEQRLAALEIRIEADLAASHHGELLGELHQLVAAHPRRERLAGQLMLALYRCGRQADALEVFSTTRGALVSEIGVEPGPELRRLHAAILRHDEGLESKAAVVELPPELDAGSASPLVGRRDELAWLRLRWNRARDGAGGLVTLAGVSGSGKLRLAAELAGIVHDAGDVVLYASGSGPPDAFLTAVRRTAQTMRPALLVIHAADRAGVEALAELDSLSRAVDDLPVFVVACVADADALHGLRSDGVLTLDALDAEAVVAIAQQYARGTTAEEVPAHWLLEASGGNARVVHEVASQWARREAARRVGAVAGRAASGREELRSIQAELTGDVEDLQAVRARITPRRWEAPVVCPFKGLASFDFDDAPYFFGREKLIAELVARLVGAQLIGVVGPSGSGKSSVMRAGLLPALAGGVLPGSDRWQRVLIRPGEHPLRELTEAMAAVVDDERCVVAVDQFEETFTTCEDESERAAFIAELGRLAGDRDRGFVVVIALRADFYGRCAAYPQLAGPLAANHVLVPAMQRAELRRAIDLPARSVGLRADPELVDALVADVQDEPGALPLLSTALLELWQRRDGRRLRHAVYEQTGGVRGAVARLAEDAFGQLDANQQALARGVLLRLASEGAGGGVERRRVALAELETDRNEDLARVVTLLTDRRLLTVSSGTIELAHEALLREWPRLTDWIDADREGLRIHRMLNAAAHEWEQLGRDGDALYRGARLGEACEWRDARGPSLNDLERDFLRAGEVNRNRDRVTRRRRTALVLGALTISLAAAIVAAIFANEQRRIAESRELATKASSLLATDPGLALAVALEALRRSDTEQAQSVVRQATLAHRATHVVKAHDPLAFGVAPSPDGRFAATAGSDRTVRIWELSSGRRVGEIRGYGGAVRGVSFSRDGTRIASVAEDGEIAVADADGGRRRRVVRLDRGEFARNVEFSPNGKQVVVGTSEGRVLVVRLSDRKIVTDTRPRHIDVVWDVDFDRDGRRVVSAGEDRFARIWNVAGGAPVELAHGQRVIAASFSRDGADVATADAAGVVRLWDSRSGLVRLRIQVGDHLLLSVRFSADGHRLVTADEDGVISVVSIPHRAVVAEVRGHQGLARADFVPHSNAVVSAGEEDGTLRISTPPATRLPLHPGTLPRFSRQGGLVVSSDVSGDVSGDPPGTIYVWNPATGEERRFAGHSDESVPQFSPDGAQIVSASYDETVRLWDVRSGRSRIVPTRAGLKYAAAIDASGQRIAIGGETPLVIQAPDGSLRRELRGSNGNVNTLVFSPDSADLLTGGDDGIVRVWDARTGRLERPLRGHDGIIRDVAYGDRGQLIATAGSDATARVWPADGGAAVVLVGHEGAVNTARFDDSGDRLVTAGDDGRILIWNAAGGGPLVELYRHEGAATGAEFSEDGRTVVSAGEDGMQVTVCDVCGTLEETLRVARTRAQHTLTAAERRRLLSGE